MPLRSWLPACSGFLSAIRTGGGCLSCIVRDATARSALLIVDSRAELGCSRLAGSAPAWPFRYGCRRPLIGRGGLESGVGEGELSQQHGHVFVEPVADVRVAGPAALRGAFTDLAE